jgi:hypothetical protein
LTSCVSGPRKPRRERKQTRLLTSRYGKRRGRTRASGSKEVEGCRVPSFSFERMRSGKGSQGLTTDRRGNPLAALGCAASSFAALDSVLVDIASSHLLTWTDRLFIQLLRPTPLNLKTFRHIHRVNSHFTACLSIETTYLHYTHRRHTHTHTSTMSHHGNNDDAMSRTTSISRRQGSTMSKNQSLVSLVCSVDVLLATSM